MRHRAALPAHAFVQVGLEDAEAGAGRAWTRSSRADVVLIAPSNPVVSIGTILGLPDIRDAVGTTAGPGGRACRRSSAARRCAAWPTPACR